MEKLETVAHDCKRSMIEKKATQESPYHFTDSGLPNVFLAGIKYYVCKICSAVVKSEIPAIQDLMNALGRAIVTKESPLVGIEVQFLRKRLGIKQADFASMIDSSTEQLSRWENDHNALSGAMDRFIRLAYTFISKDSKLKALAAKVKEDFQEWSTSFHKSGKEERILAHYQANKQWCALTEPLAA